MTTNVDLTTDTANRSTLYTTLCLPYGSRSIRVLDVHGPSNSEDGGPLRCDLRVIDLDSECCPPFTALSYVWGIEMARSYSITCNSSILTITSNCHSALHHLRNKFSEFTIWIDAICINQGDDREKENQIQIMGDIYSAAETVFVWLGDGDMATDRAMDYLEGTGYREHFFSNSNKSIEQIPLKLAIYNASWCGFIALLSVRGPLYPSQGHPEPIRLSQFVAHLRKRRVSKMYPSCDDLNKLLDREWIKRLWTYQEILLASNPVIVCGHSHLPWSEFAIGILFLEYSGINYRRQAPIINRLSTWAAVSLARDHIEFKANPSQHPKGEERTQLQRYQTFVIRVTQHIQTLERLNFAIIVIFGYFTFVIGFIWSFMRSDEGISMKPSKVPDSVNAAADTAISSVTTCARECNSGNITACATACSAALSAVSIVASSSNHIIGGALYQDIDLRYGLPFSVLAFILVVSLLVLLKTTFSKQLRPNLRFPCRSPNFDLVDGLCYRRSREEKDKAFGVQAVLQRLSKTTLRPFESSESLEQIYKQLCIQILGATGSVQFLLPATLHNFPGHPSWVPNWAAEFDSFWLNPTLFKSQPLNATPGSRGLGRLASENNNILHVRGHQICSVLECAMFRETWSTFHEDQEEIHLHNLQVILRFRHVFRWEAGSLCWGGLGLLQCLDKHQYKAWSRFLKWAQDQDLQTALSTLKTRNATFTFKRYSFAGKSFSMEEILSTQISVCNNLAKTGRMMFMATGIRSGQSLVRLNMKILFGDGASLGDVGITKTMCIGSHSVRVGDAVVLVSGVSSPLVIRRSDNSTKLVSPAIVKGAMDGEVWDSTWTEDDLEEFILS